MKIDRRNLILARFFAARYAIWRMLALSLAVGIVAGLGAIAFYWLLNAGKYLFLDLMAGYHTEGPGGEPALFGPTAMPLRKWVLFLLPAVGGLISGALVYRFAPEAEGHGTDAAIDAYHHKGGSVRGRVPFVKALASAITIGSGGSGGREGPIAQIGAGFGSTLARWLRLTPRERRTLMAAGMAGGVGAIFHAPMAGALFAAEVLYRDLDLEYEVIIPSVISSITAYALFAMQFGWDPLFVTPPLVFEHPLGLLAYLVLGAAVAGGAIVYVRTFYSVRNLFRRLRVPRFLKPALGGLVVGGIGLMVPDALGTGYGVLQRALANGTDLAGRFGEIGVLALLAVVAAKILTTSFSIGSGGSGGVFGPAIVIGGSLGGAVGLLIGQVFPGLHLDPGSFVIVGMAGFFAAAANTPISTIIMVSEMTGSYRLLVPALLVCTVGYLLARRHALYEKQVQNRFDAPVHRGNMMAAVLRNVAVDEVLAASGTGSLHTLRPETGLADVLHLFATTHQSSLPVVDEDGEMIGIVRGREVRLVATRKAEGLYEAFIAQDLVSPAPTITRRDSLLTAVRRMAAADIEELPVVEQEGSRRLVAILRHSDVLDAYDRLIAHDLQRRPSDAA